MIEIRHALQSERDKIYDWLAFSDTASMHMGEPDYPENPVPTREEFDLGFEEFYFKEDTRKLGSVMIIESDGIEIGCMCYACFHLKPQAAELDIWMNARKYCGNGYGSAALVKMIDYLRRDFNVKNFIIRPSEKNKRAIRAYEKAGFRSVEDKTATIANYLSPQYVDQYGFGDYGFENTAVLVSEESY
jgi:diamine N-acetyltransferase